MAGNRCCVCHGPVLWSPVDPICQRCVAELYPEAAARRADTQHAYRVKRTAASYEQAREADEVDAPPKRKGRLDEDRL